jgi:hypothetical protein
MDNSIIDSCREASGEAKFANDVTEDMQLKSVKSNVRTMKNYQREIFKV